MFGGYADVEDEVAKFEENRFERFLHPEAAVVCSDRDGTGGVNGGADLGSGEFDEGDSAFARQIAGRRGYNCPGGYFEMSMRRHVLCCDYWGHTSALSPMT